MNKNFTQLHIEQSIKNKNVFDQKRVDEELFGQSWTLQRKLVRYFYKGSKTFKRTGLDNFKYSHIHTRFTSA